MGFTWNREGWVPLAVTLAMWRAPRQGCEVYDECGDWSLVEGVMASSAPDGRARYRSLEKEF